MPKNTATAITIKRTMFLYTKIAKIPKYLHTSAKTNGCRLQAGTII